MNTLLTRGIDQIIGQPELEAALKSGRKLKIKFGVDPTSPDIHIGHAVVMHKIREFQDAGHTVIFLIGDYTTKIGDPSGRNNTRPLLTDEQIAINAKTFFDQAGLIIDMTKAIVRYNSEWLGKLSFANIILLAQQVSVAQLIEREDFSKRLKAGEELALHELMYPLMQAYDSVELEADIEMGGTDQLFNLLMGRSLQRKSGQTPQIVITCPLLVGLDGTKKMSKSLGNYIGLTDAATDMYGKVMSLPDSLIAPYYNLCTKVSLSAIDALVATLASGANPRDSKASLAREIVRTYHGEPAALEAEDNWNKQFREGGRPDDIPTVIVQGDLDLLDLITACEMATSRSEARRLVEQGGVKLDNQVQQLNNHFEYINDQILQVGKRRYSKLKIA